VPPVGLRAIFTRAPLLAKNNRPAGPTCAADALRRAAFLRSSDGAPRPCAPGAPARHLPCTAEDRFRHARVSRAGGISMTRSAARLCLVACLFLLAPAAGAQPAADTAEPAVEAPPGTAPVDPAPDTAAQREREAQDPGAAATSPAAAAAESETGLAG